MHAKVSLSTKVLFKLWGRAAVVIALLLLSWSIYQSHYSELNLSWSTANTIYRSESTSVELTNSTIVPLVHRPQLPKCNYYSNSTSYLRRYYATAAFHWSCHNFYRRRCLRSQLFVFRFASRLQCLSQHPQVGDYQNTFRKQYGWPIEHVYTR